MAGFLSVSLLAVVATAVLVDGQCDSGWSYLAETDQCYRKMDSGASYSSAVDNCAANGGLVASVNSQAQQDHLETLIGSDRIFLGITDSHDEGDWILSDGSKLMWTNWDSGEPNNANSGEHCVVMKDGEHKWNDNDCSKSYRYICSKPSTGCPTPWTLSSTTSQCLRYISDQGSRSQAQTRCHNRLSDLASVMDSAENDMIQSLIGKDVWLGLTDSGAENSFVWSNGEPLGYDNWANGEPNDAGHGGEDCAEMKSGTGQWNDIQCHSGQKAAICGRQASICGSQWADSGSRCYRYYLDAQSYDDAIRTCQVQGGQLAHAASSAEDNALRHIMTVSSIWLGMDDKESENTWKLSNGETATYTNWNNGEPNNAGGEDCVEMKSNGKWNDIPCSGRVKSFICYKELNVVQKRGAVQAEAVKKSDVMIDNLIARLLAGLEK